MILNADYIFSGDGLIYSLRNMDKRKDALQKLVQNTALISDLQLIAAQESLLRVLSNIQSKPEEIKHAIEPPGQESRVVNVLYQLLMEHMALRFGFWTLNHEPHFIEYLRPVPLKKTRKSKEVDLNAVIDDPELEKVIDSIQGLGANTPFVTALCKLHWHQITLQSLLGNQ